MSDFNDIQEKLKEFVKKYYTNELIKGLILFSSFGLLYFLITVFIEYFLWLNTFSRSILFWVFIAVESILVFRFIVRPILKLIGIQKGISTEKASELIGIHFKEVDDKLLNIIQLNNNLSDSELVLASIEQKSKELQPIPFKKAVNFSTNKKYLRLLVIPFVIWLITFITGNVSLFSQSYKRVVNYETVYLPPAPFSFKVLNDSFSVIEGDDVVIQIITEGDIVPEDVKINFEGQSVFVQNVGVGSFEYLFSALNEDVTFYIEANDVRSENYDLEVVKTPKILNFEMWVDYPAYTGKVDELIKNTGNVVVPIGTSITWNVDSRNTDWITFKGEKEEKFESIGSDKFELKKKLFKNLDYEISSGNKELNDFEALSFSAKVIKDGYPKIEVRSDIDSIESGPVQFLGQISDDYWVSKLELVYYDKDNSENKKRLNLDISNSGFEKFYYVFPEGIELKEGLDYELFFEVFDNDKVHGSKSSKSGIFAYYNNTEEELNDELLKEQEKVIEDLERSLDLNKEVNEDFKKLEESLQNKSEMQWNDKKSLENFVKRQKQYQEMMQEQKNELQQNLESQPKSDDKSLEEKREDLEKRLEEAKNMSKQEELLKELEKLAEKLDKEQLTEKLKELSKNNRQNERNLERLLELTKRFYVEQKANQIKEKVNKLAEDEEKLSDSEENDAEKQNKLNQEFEEIKKELDNLDKENKKLQKPMDFPDTKQSEGKIDEDMKEALEELQRAESHENKEGNNSKEKQKKASKKQKMAAQKLKQMSEQMQSAMQSMQGESMDEDIEMLRSILENLVEFSFQQEDLLYDFSNSNSGHPEFSKRLKKQNVLKEYFEHIDDSLYALSMRQPKIGSVVFKELADVHFYLDESLEHLADNQYNVGLSDQQFVMTGTNNIAVLLSDILNGLQSASPSMGKGIGDSFSLPDIIEKQQEGVEKMEDGVKKGMKKGESKEKGDEGKEGEKGDGENGEGDGEGISGELFEIYKEQVALRKLLEESLKDKESFKGGAGKNALKQMEDLEKDLLERGFSKEVLVKMKNLKYELMKLEEASYKQGRDVKKEARTNKTTFENGTIKDIDRSKLWFIEEELLLRQSLPLRQNYKVKVQNYFKFNDSIQ